MAYTLTSKPQKVGKSLQIENFQFLLPEKGSQVPHIRTPSPRTVLKITKDSPALYFKKEYLKPKTSLPQLKKTVKREGLNLNELLRETLKKRERTSLKWIIGKDHHKQNKTEFFEPRGSLKLVKFEGSKRNRTYVMELNPNSDSKGRLVTEETMNYDTPRGERAFFAAKILSDKLSENKPSETEETWNQENIVRIAEEVAEAEKRGLTKEQSACKTKEKTGKILPARFKCSLNNGELKRPSTDFALGKLNQNCESHEFKLEIDRYKNKIKCTFPQLHRQSLENEMRLQALRDLEEAKNAQIKEESAQVVEEIKSPEMKDKWKLFGSLFQKKKILLEIKERLKTGEPLKRATWINMLEEQLNDEAENELLSYRELLQNFKREKESYALIRKHLKDRLLLIKKLGIPRNDISNMKVFSTEPFAKKKSFDFLRAAKRGDFISLTYLLTENKYLVYDFDYFHLTALHWASRRGFFDVAMLLLKSGADVDSRDIIGRTPLYFALRAKHKEAVQLLLYHKANPWSSKYYDVNSLLEDFIEGKILIKKARMLSVAVNFTLPKQKEICWDSDGTFSYLQPYGFHDKVKAMHKRILN